MITTLPLNANKKGVLSLALVAAVLAEQSGKELILLLNSMGYKKSSQEEMESFLQELYFWNIHPKKVSFDSDLYPEKIPLSQGIQSQEDIIYNCTCGRVEIPEEVYKNRDTKFKMLDSSGLCCVCKTIERQECTSLYEDVFRPPYKINIFPEKYSNSVSSIFLQEKRRISRLRATGYFGNFGGVEHNLDVDFMHILYARQQAATHCGATFVFSSKSIDFAARVCSPKTNLIFSPYIKNFELVYQHLKDNLFDKYQFFALLMASGRKKSPTISFSYEQVKEVSKKDPYEIRLELKRRLNKLSQEAEKNTFLGQMRAIWK